MKKQLSCWAHRFHMVGVELFAKVSQALTQSENKWRGVLKNGSNSSMKLMKQWLTHLNIGFAVVFLSMEITAFIHWSTSMDERTEPFLPHNDSNYDTTGFHAVGSNFLYNILFFLTAMGLVNQRWGPDLCLMVKANFFALHSLPLIENQCHSRKTMAYLATTLVIGECSFDCKQ